MSTTVGVSTEDHFHGSSAVRSIRWGRIGCESEEANASSYSPLIFFYSEWCITINMIKEGPLVCWVQSNTESDWPIWAFTGTRSKSWWYSFLLSTIILLFIHLHIARVHIHYIICMVLRAIKWKKDNTFSILTFVGCHHFYLQHELG